MSRFTGAGMYIIDQRVDTYVHMHLWMCHLSIIYNSTHGMACRPHKRIPVFAKISDNIVPRELGDSAVRFRMNQLYAYVRHQVKDINRRDANAYTSYSPVYFDGLACLARYRTLESIEKLSQEV